MAIKSLFNRFGSHGSLDSSKHISSFSVVVIGEPNSGKSNHIRTFFLHLIYFYFYFIARWFGTFSELKNRLSVNFDSKNTSKEVESDETSAKLVRFKHSQVAFSEVEGLF